MPSVFDTPDFLHHSLAFLCEPPAALAHRAREQAQAHPEVSGWNHLSPEEREQAYPAPDSAPVQAAQAVANDWMAHTPLYDRAHVHEALGLRENIHTWGWRKGIPRLLTAAQVEWLCLQAEKNGNPRGKGLIDRGNPHHPWPPGEFIKPRVKSKVGSIYGTWRLTACLSDSENTSDNANPLYSGVCVQCGYKHSRLQYRTMSQTRCISCVALKRRGRLPSTGLQQPVCAWLLDDGRMSFGPHAPANAVATCSIEDFGKAVEWQVLPGITAVFTNIVRDTHLAKAKGDLPTVAEPLPMTDEQQAMVDAAAAPVQLPTQQDNEAVQQAAQELKARMTGDMPFSD